MARTKSSPKKPGHLTLSALKRRFKGEPGRQLLIAALKDQKMIAGNIGLASEIASKGELIFVKAKTAVIEQGADDNHVYFVVSGSFDVVVNGKPVAKRHATDHAGEMAAVQPSQSRSATVVAAENSVILKVTEPQLAALGTRYPEIYRLIAKELAKRLLQRNNLLTRKRNRIRIFILSSAETLELARGIQKAFKSDPYDVVIWSEGMFRTSRYAVENLELELDHSDFAIVIAQPDNLDNVWFELGLFIGRLGRHRALLLLPRGNGVKVPSDLKSLSAIPYPHSASKDLVTALRPACSQIRKIIDELGSND